MTRARDKKTLKSANASSHARTCVRVVVFPARGANRVVGIVGIVVVVIIIMT